MPTIPNPEKLLKGVYATSFTSHIYLIPPAPPGSTGVPQIGAYQPSTTPGQFTQVSGYRLASVAMYLDFDGNGNLSGGGYVNRGGYTRQPKTFTGVYSVNSQTPMSGTFDTDDGGFVYQYYWIMTDNWRRLEFIVFHGNPNGTLFDHEQVAAGTLVKVDSHPPGNPN